MPACRLRLRVAEAIECQQRIRSAQLIDFAAVSLRFYAILGTIKILIIRCQTAPRGGCLTSNKDFNRPIIRLINGLASGWQWSSINRGKPICTAHLAGTRHLEVASSMAFASERNGFFDWVLTESHHIESGALNGGTICHIRRLLTLGRMEKTELENRNQFTFCLPFCWHNSVTTEPAFGRDAKHLGVT